MAFGQAGGPPASGRQVSELLELLGNLGYSDFRDARGPMGFNQRQAGGKFTSDEAQTLIDELLEAEHQADLAADGDAPAADAACAPEPPAIRRAAPKPKVTKTERLLRDISSEHLAAELQRRGWIVAEP